MDEPEFERFSLKTKTAIASETLHKIDAHYDGGLALWKKRYKSILKADRNETTFLNIAVTQLFESYEKGHRDALKCLDKLIRCVPERRCFQILCPACRSKKQQDVSQKTLASFADIDSSDIRFMTLLIRVEKDAWALPDLIQSFRKALQCKLHNNKLKLGTDLAPMKIIGAFEIDLKNLATQWDLSLRSQNLVKTLGFDPRHKPSQYLLHLHAIVGQLNDARQEVLIELIEKSLGKTLLPHQRNFRSLHKINSKDENLSRLASYMYKARLQFADNIFEDNQMQKKAKYHTPFKGNELVEYLNVVNEMQNFKGLKFEFGI